VGIPAKGPKLPPVLEADPEQQGLKQMVDKALKHMNIYFMLLQNNND
jgi:hypothetical protein